MVGDLHPAPATESVQGTGDSAISVAAAVLLHVPVVLETVCRAAYHNTRTPKTLATKAEGAAAAHQAFLPTR